MKRLTSIRSILLLAFTLSLLIPVLVILLYAHFITSRALASQALERQLHEVSLQAQHIEQSLERVQDHAVYLANLSSMRQLNLSEVEQDLTVFATANPIILRLLYLGEDTISIGIDNSSTTPRSISADVMQNIEYQALHQQYAAMNASQFVVSFDMLWDSPVLRYSLRLNDGILVIEVLASWVLRNMPPAEANSIWAILNSNGHHLLFPLASEDFEGAIPASDSAISPYLSQFQTVAGTFDVEGNTFIYSRIYPGNDNRSYWLLYQQVPRSELYAVVNDFYRTSFIILVMAVIAVFGVSAIIARQIIRPLLELKRKVREFAQGTTPHKSSQTLQLSELNDLNQSFYQMAEQLSGERQENRRLIKQLISAQEDERKRIAYDLHDGLIQQLVVAKMYISLLKDDFDTGELTNINLSEKALKQAIVDGRRMIEGLHPTVLDDLGLVDAIVELANQQAGCYGWNLELNLEKLPHEPDKTVSISVFRIVQEALNNIGKHAQASEVSIHLSNGTAVQLSIEDDGCGFDERHSHNQAGIGIGTMRERAKSLGGECRIESTPDEGTKVLVKIPYNQSIFME